jgi:hypothetical protein
MAFKDIQRIVHGWYQIGVKPQIDSMRDYSYAKEIALGIAGALVLVAGVWGYRSYIHRKESAAQVAFAENMTLYREAMQGKADIWPQVEQKSSTDYEHYKHSSMAPYLLMIKADSLAKQAKGAQAIEAIGTVVASLPKESPVMPLYKTKLALMKIDMQDDALRAQGVDELRKLALDKDNKNNDVAQYYLGLYHWTRNELTEALDIWKNLVASQASEKLAASPWASLAQEKLAQRSMLPESAPIEAPAA